MKWPGDEKYPRRRYRYITAPCGPETYIADLELLSAKDIKTVGLIPGSVYYRVWIPENMKIVKYPYNDYATTDDPRRVCDLEYDFMIVTWDGKGKVISKNMWTNHMVLSAREFSKWKETVE